jgi:hypothetical protein
MRSKQPGRPISELEVSTRTNRGVWFVLDGRRVFAAFQDFPWFRKATLAELRRIERPTPSHLYWPALDVDLEIEALEHPSRYPLISRL